MEVIPMIRKIIVFLLLVSPLHAQSFTGTISGRVMDSSGAVIPQVAVTVTDAGTNTSFRTMTSETGDYSVTFLNQGSYRVSFTVPGFKEAVEKDVILQLNQNLRIDKIMELGVSSESVEVSAATSQLNFASAEIGHVVGEEQLLN